MLKDSLRAEIADDGTGLCSDSTFIRLGTAVFNRGAGMEGFDVTGMTLGFGISLLLRNSSGNSRLHAFEASYIILKARAPNQ